MISDEKIEKVIKKSTIDTFLPMEIGVLGRRLDKISILNFNETAMQIDGTISDDIREEIVIERNRIVEHCISSINRLKKLIIKVADPSSEALKEL